MQYCRTALLVLILNYTSFPLIYSTDKGKSIDICLKLSRDRNGTKARGRVVEACHFAPLKKKRKITCKLYYLGKQYRAQMPREVAATLSWAADPFGRGGVTSERFDFTAWKSPAPSFSFLL